MGWVCGCVVDRRSGISRRRAQINQTLTDSKEQAVPRLEHARTTLVANLLQLFPGHAGRIRGQSIAGWSH